MPVLYDSPSLVPAHDGAAQLFWQDSNSCFQIRATVCPECLFESIRLSCLVKVLVPFNDIVVFERITIVSVLPLILRVVSYLVENTCFYCWIDRSECAEFWS